MLYTHKKITQIALLAVLLIQSLAVHAASVLPLGLERLVGGADIVFHGRCLANQVELDASTNMVVTYTTFEVLDTVKGEPGITHTIKQIGGNLPGSNVHMKWPGVPKFIEGEEYVVFLPPQSVAGFSSPVGLGQGNFKVLPGSQGQDVSNGRDFEELLKNIPTGSVPASVMTRMTQKFSTHSANTPQGAASRARMGLNDFMATLRSIGPTQ